ncbi:MAG: DegV family protein [Dehalogenimonas sp.]
MKKISIVTDSTSDISPSLARELGITIVPAIVRFGDRVFHDGVDLTPDEFYHLLKTSEVHPHTSQPSPGDFAQVFCELGQKSEGVVCATISSKLSGIYNAAVLGRDMAGIPCPVEIVDSKFNSAGLGLIAIAAARVANSGGTLKEVMSEVESAIGQVKMLGIFDTLEYMVRGGRVSRVKGVAAKLLGVKPMLTFNNGEVVQSGLVRTYNLGIKRLADFIGQQKGLVDVAISHSQIPDKVNDFQVRIAKIWNKNKVMVFELGPALGVHGGPGVLLVAVRIQEG